MNEDKYFERKAEELFKEIKFQEGWTNDCVFTLNDLICKFIYMLLKEVTQDQRYACVHAMHNSNFNICTASDIDDLIKDVQNAIILEGE